MNIQVISQYYIRQRLLYWYYTVFTYTLRPKMNLETILTAGAGALVTALVWLLTGGYRQRKIETEDKLINAVTTAGAFLAESNNNLLKEINKISTDHEHQIKELEKKFELKERTYILKIENLELENKNLKLENANLLIENDKLNREAGLRRIG